MHPLLLCAVSSRNISPSVSLSIDELREGYWGWKMPIPNVSEGAAKGGVHFWNMLDKPGSDGEKIENRRIAKNEAKADIDLHGIINS